jgi:hypothetical protein
MKLFFIGLLLVFGCSGNVPGVWDRGVIPWYAVGFNEDELTTIWSAMTEWQLATGGKVKFKFSIDDNSLKIIKADRNNIFAGLSDSKDKLIILTGDITPRLILHELGHQLGLIHEHQRLDRDLFIKLTEIDGQILYITQLMQIEPQLYDYKKYPYDYDSIMHYDPAQFWTMGYNIDMKGHERDKRDHVSIIDALKVIDIYSEK